MFNITEYPDFTSHDDNGQDLVLGTRFRIRRGCTAVAFRYFKADDEDGKTRTGYIYGPNGQVVGTTGPFHDSVCPGPRWVQVPLVRPIRLSPGVEYTTGVDFIDFYPKTEFYFPADKDQDLVPLGGYFTTTPGGFPNLGTGTTNYWVDCKSRPCLS